MKNGNCEAAIGEFSKAIVVNPNYAPAYSARGDAYRQSGQQQKAIEDCSKAIELEPKSAIAYGIRGYAYWCLSQYQNAVDDCSKAIQLYPIYVFAYETRGAAYKGWGQHQKAIEDCSKAIELDPKNSNAYATRGDAEIGLGQYQKAVDDSSKAIELYPKSLFAYGTRGAAFRKLGNYEKAIEDCTKAIELYPNYLFAYGTRSEAYRELKQYQKAIEDCSKGVALDPRNFTAYIRRGQVYGDLGQYQKAIDDYSKAIELAPNAARAYSGRGDAYRKLGQHQKAVDDCQKAIALDPSERSAFVTGGESYRQLGQFHKAHAFSNAAVVISGKDTSLRVPETQSGVKAEPNKTVSYPGQNYAILIGTNNYKNQFPPLFNAVNDARALQQILEQFYGWKTKLLENPTRQQIRFELTEAVNQPRGADDQLFVYIAGHGIELKRMKDGYIVASDSEPDEYGDTYISFTDIKKWLNRGQFNKVLLALDVCHGGVFLEDLATRRLRGAATESSESSDNELGKAIEDAKGKCQRKLVTASADKPAYDGSRGGHSPFADKLLRKLRYAGDGRGYVRFSDLMQVAQDTQPGGFGVSFDEQDNAMGDFLFIPQN